MGSKHPEWRDRRIRPTHQGLHPGLPLAGHRRPCSNTPLRPGGHRPLESWPCPPRTRGHSGLIQALWPQESEGEEKPGLYPSSAASLRKRGEEGRAALRLRASRRRAVSPATRQPPCRDPVRRCSAAAATPRRVTPGAKCAPARSLSSPQTHFTDGETEAQSGES